MRVGGGEHQVVGQGVEESGPFFYLADFLVDAAIRLRVLAKAHRSVGNVMHDIIIETAPSLVLSPPSAKVIDGKIPSRNHQEEAEGGDDDRWYGECPKYLGVERPCQNCMKLERKPCKIASRPSYAHKKDRRTDQLTHPFTGNAGISFEPTRLDSTVLADIAPRTELDGTILSAEVDVPGLAALDKRMLLSHVS